VSFYCALLHLMYCRVLYTLLPTVGLDPSAQPLPLLHHPHTMILT
jgi:hypothetical protein